MNLAADVPSNGLWLLAAGLLALGLAACVSAARGRIFGRSGGGKGGSA